MNRLEHKTKNQRARKARVRSTVIGTKARPRLSVKVSNRHLIAQIVDDASNSTLAYVTSSGSSANGTMINKATWVGEQIAEKAKAAKVRQVVFDRGNHLYHGRVKALAEAARSKGLEF